jgi:type VI secretion system protein VasD
MTPGQHTEVRAALSEQTNYLAVMAAYRDIERSNWRYVMPVSFREKNAKTLIFQAQGIVEKD